MSADQSRGFIPQIDYVADRFGTWAWWAKCDCGWVGPNRGTLKEARSDSTDHQAHAHSESGFVKQQRVRSEIAKQLSGTQSTMKYATIVADPPWHYDAFVSSMGDKRVEGVKERGTIKSKPLPYPSMSLEEIADLPVGSLAERDAFLFMWTTNAYLPSAFWLCTTWGFSYRQMIVWDKGSSMSPLGGAIAPNAAEYLLFCRRGQPRLKGRWDAGCVVQANKGSHPGMHSRKPDVFLDLVETVCPGPYLEMFARRQRLGWDTWGNEALEHVELSA